MRETDVRAYKHAEVRFRSLDRAANWGPLVFSKRKNVLSQLERKEGRKGR